MAAPDYGVLPPFAELLLLTWRDRERVPASQLREGDYLSLSRRVVTDIEVNGDELRVRSTAGGATFVNLWSPFTPVFRSPTPPDHLL